MKYSARCGRREQPPWALFAFFSPRRSIMAMADFYRAFIFAFQDKQRWPKLALGAVLTCLSLLPLLGLPSLCAWLGYLAMTARNVIGAYPRPLPAWSPISAHIRKGAPVLLAIVCYNLPPLIILALLYAFRPAIAVSLFGSITYTGLLALLLPLLLLYLGFAWSLLALGLLRYVETWQAASFYQRGPLLRDLQAHSALTLQWLIASLAASILLLLLLPLALVLYAPAQGYLLGLYGRRLRAAKLAHRQGRA